MLKCDDDDYYYLIYVKHSDVILLSFRSLLHVECNFTKLEVNSRFRKCDALSWYGRIHCILVVSNNLGKVFSFHQRFNLGI